MGKLFLLAVMMFCFGYLLIPMYRMVCDITGINILAAQENINESVSNTQIDESRIVNVEFDANAIGPWSFKPNVTSINVHPGEIVNVVYEVTNLQKRPMDAQAIPSYAPQVAAKYFLKMECFCFKQQTLAPNEVRNMPVSFYVDPDLPKGVNVITLSYTFFEVGLKAKS
tara:strand:- start:176 stop:682 length:507 start_codon:yes stop_codon:yes gene_type:complete